MGASIPRGCEGSQGMAGASLANQVQRLVHRGSDTAVELEPRGGIKWNLMFPGWEVPIGCG